MASSLLTTLLKPAFNSLPPMLKNDTDFQASAAGMDIDFGICAYGGDSAIKISVQKGSVTISEDKLTTPSFTLSARAEDWEKFFQSPPPRFYQSYWGLLRTFAGVSGVCILGDSSLFSKHARIWRIILDRIRDCLAGTPAPDSSSIPAAELTDEDSDSDSIIGRYARLHLPTWGPGGGSNCKVFYETSGTGPLALLFLHTAGADSRQNHSVMNNKSLHSRCTMYAFDLPNHGRSYPASNIPVDGFALTEEMYIDAISAFIRKLKLNKPIVCGASMGGQICLAVAMRAKEMGVGGVIPLEACAHIPFSPPIYEAAGEESLLNPERVCGMISPTAPEYYKKLVWWIYSSQGLKVFAGDLRFYFQGWDGRARLREIDTAVCPVYMLTGEYDYSCSCEMSEETAREIERGNVVFERMLGLGHFPLTEDPERFVPYLVRAVEFVEKHRRG